MSAPEYAEARGISGTAIAARVELLDSAEKRSLLFWLQTIARRDAGLRKLAQVILNAHPENLGTPKMHAAGISPKKVYDVQTAVKIDCEINTDKGRWLALARFNAVSEELFEGNDHSSQSIKEYESSVERSAARLLEQCRERFLESCPAFLEQLCIDPAIEFNAPEEIACASDEERVQCESQFNQRLCFRNLEGVLYELKRRDGAAIAADFAPTEITKKIFRTLERALHSRKIVVIDGVEGIGKSFSAEVWSKLHAGEARFVRLEGIVNKTTFFRSVSQALDLASSLAQKCDEMQSRIRNYLERSGIMLVIDEAHRLFPQTERIYSHPEMLNWIYTLWDFHIPVALLVTPQFVTRMDEVERQTDWRSGQFKRRVELWTRLPDRLSEQDLRTVAHKLAAAYSPRMLDELVDYAIPTRRQLDAIARVISASEFIAAENGRPRPTLSDLEAGISEAQTTDLAMTTGTDRERQNRTRPSSRRVGRRAAAGAPQDRSEAANVSDDSAPPDFASAMNARGTTPRGLDLAPA